MNLRKLFANLSIINALMILTFLVINTFFNSAMGFMEAQATTVLLFSLCIFTLITSVSLLVMEFHVRARVDRSGKGRHSAEDVAPFGSENKPVPPPLKLVPKKEEKRL